MKGPMKMQLQAALSFLLLMVLIQQITSQASNTSESSWTCLCSSAHQESQSFIILANCSGFCDCRPAGSTGNNWSCVCATGQLPHLATENQNNGCFTACNCASAGSASDVNPPRKRISSKVVVITLIVCLTLLALAFVVSLACHYYRKYKYQPQQMSSDKESSYGSAIDPIKHKSSFLPPSRASDSSIANSVEGYISNASFMFRRKREKTRDVVTHFPYSELEQATHRFSDANLIGVGGSSHVYRGLLQDGKTVGVKRLKTSGVDSDSEFFKEVELISRLHHCHIVSLLGYCSISSGKRRERLLVFEYMPNGNLRDCLDGAAGKHLDWRARISIALGAAKGLEYLHEAAAPRILHRDVKSTNILLDEHWRAKVTDLGMAKHLGSDDVASCSSSPERIQGTFGYFAPEYAIVGKGSVKADVFSFGVVLLELITGRAPIFSVSDREESLVMWAAPRLHNNKRVISDLPDPHLGRNFPEEEMQIMAYLAKECLLLDPESRPSMSEVVQVISTIAPDKSNRRTFSASFFQNLSFHNTKSEELFLDKSTNQVEVVVDSEDLKQMCASRWSSRSLSYDADYNLMTDSVAQPINLSSGHFIDRLVSYNGRSNIDDDDDIVDLTEPRLESFCVENGR